MSTHAWGRVLLGAGQLEQAEQVARVGVARFGALWQLRDLHAVSLALLGRKADAWTVLKQASVELLPSLQGEEMPARSALGATAAMIANPPQARNEGMDCDLDII